MSWDFNAYKDSIIFIVQQSAMEVYYLSSSLKHERIDFYSSKLVLSNIFVIARRTVALSFHHDNFSILRQGESTKSRVVTRMARSPGRVRNAHHFRCHNGQVVKIVNHIQFAAN